MTAFDRDITKLEPGPTRLATKGRKIPRKVTGFNGSIFIHFDFDPKNGNRIHGVRLSEKSKDGSGLDRLLHAIGDAATDIAREIQSTPEEKR